MRSARVIEELPAITEALKGITRYQEPDNQQKEDLNDRLALSSNALWTMEFEPLDPCDVIRPQTPFAKLGERPRIERYKAKDGLVIPVEELLEATHISILGLSIIAEKRAKIVQTHRQIAVAREIRGLVPLALADSKEVFGVRRLAEERDSMGVLSPLLSIPARWLVNSEITSQSRPIKLSTNQ